MDFQLEAEFLYEKWRLGEREGMLDSLDEYGGRTRLAILVQLVLMMLDNPASGDLPDLLEMLENGS